MKVISQKIREEVVRFRRDLHQIPEVGFLEEKTSRYIQEKLIAYDFQVKKVAKTGVIGFRKGRSNQRCIAFRADMDGLMVNEETGLSYRSKHPGQMHACGHDGHMAILLGFAAYLGQFDELERDILFIFQPAEEGPGGAKLIIEAGILEKYQVEAIFGLHIFPGINEGKVGITSGPLMAQSGEVDIIVRGKSGHGAMPHKGIDGIYVASQLISAYQSVISRDIDPIEGAVITIGRIQGGEARNVIAGSVQMEGTIRAFRSEVYHQIKDRMENIHRGIEQMYGVEIEMVVRDSYPPVVNNHQLFTLVQKILAEQEIELVRPLMIAEDFSYYQQVVPGFFFLLGSRNKELGFINPLHSSRFDFNDDVLSNGVELYVKVGRNLGLV